MFISFSFFPLFISYCLCNTKLLGRKEKKRIHICSPSLPYLTPHASATLSLPFVSDMSDLYCGSVLCICYPPSLECPWLQHILCQILPCSFCYCCCSVAKLWPHGLQHARVPCLPLFPGVCSNSCPLSWWCYLIISSSATPFSFCLQSFPASGSFPVSWLFASGGKSIGALVSASVLPVNIQVDFL